MNAFDTHAFVKRLTAVGMPEPQAEVLAEGQSDLIESELATKRDMKALETELRVEIAASGERVKAEILKWMFAALLGQTAILAALIRLL